MWVEYIEDPALVMAFASMVGGGHAGAGRRVPLAGEAALRRGVHAHIAQAKAKKTETLDELLQAGDTWVVGQG